MAKSSQVSTPPRESGESGTGLFYSSDRSVHLGGVALACSFRLHLPFGHVPRLGATRVCSPAQEAGRPSPAVSANSTYQRRTTSSARVFLLLSPCPSPRESNGSVLVQESSISIRCSRLETEASRLAEDKHFVFPGVKPGVPKSTPRSTPTTTAVSDPSARHKPIRL